MRCGNDGLETGALMKRSLETSVTGDRGEDGCNFLPAMKLCFRNSDFLTKSKKMRCRLGGISKLCVECECVFNSVCDCVM